MVWKQIMHGHGYRFQIQYLYKLKGNIEEISPVLLPSAFQSFKGYFEYSGFSAKRRKSVSAFFRIVSHTLVFA